MIGETPQAPESREERRARVLRALHSLAVAGLDDEEVAHADADVLLLELIDDAEISEAWESIPKRFA